MIWKTHLAIGVAVGFYFSQYMSNPLVFIPTSIIASIFPDIDSGFSYLGRKPIFRPDSFTIQGIKPFWPIKYISKGLIRTGGKIDKVLFFTFVIIDIILVGTFVYAFF